MSNQLTQATWSPHDLHNEEHKNQIQTSAGIDQAQDRIRDLAFKLGYDGPLSPEETQWLINIAYTALGKLWHEVRGEEYRLQQQQEESQRIDELLNTPAELPPYEPVPVPEWLQSLQPQEGG